MSRKEWLKPELKQNTQKQQNVAFTLRDVEKTPGEEQARPQVAEELLSAEEEARTEKDNYAGRQTGGGRGEREVYAVARAERLPKVEPERAFEGSLGTPASGKKNPGPEKPGISNAPSSRQQPGKRPVVSERPDTPADVKPNAS
jgi:hypothetical protein